MRPFFISLPFLLLRVLPVQVALSLIPQRLLFRNFRIPLVNLVIALSFVGIERYFDQIVDLKLLYRQ